MPSFFTPQPQSIPGANPAAATRPRCDFSPGCRRLVFPPSLLCRINTTPEAGKRQERGACRVSPRGDGGGHGSSSTSGGVMTAWPQGRAPCPLSGATQGCDTGTGGSAAQAEPRLAEPGGLPRAGNGMCIGLRSWGDEPNLAWCPQAQGSAPGRWRGEVEAAGRVPNPSPAVLLRPPCPDPLLRGAGASDAPPTAWPRGSRPPAPRRAPGAGAAPSPGTGLQAGWAPPTPVPSSRV